MSYAADVRKSACKGTLFLNIIITAYSGKEVYLQSSLTSAHNGGELPIVNLRRSALFHFKQHWNDGTNLSEIS